MASTLLQFRATGSLDKELEKRTQSINQAEDAVKGRLLSETARRDLDRYYNAIGATLYAINLSYKEAMLIVDALNGYLLTSELPQLMVPNVRDAIEMDELDAKWGVDRDALMAKLKALTPIECLSIYDAVERWWNSTTSATEEVETHEQRCIMVGLIRPPRKSELTPEI